MGTKIRGGTPSPVWAFMESFDISKNGKPYLDRLRIIQTPWFSVLLHRIHTPDVDRDPHDHPWPFASLILSGGYRETVWDNPADLCVAHAATRRQGSWHVMPMTSAHKITHVNGALWTLVLTGPRRASWGFWTDAGKIDWKDYESDDVTGDVPW